MRTYMIIKDCLEALPVIQERALTQTLVERLVRVMSGPQNL